VINNPLLYSTKRAYSSVLNACAPRIHTAILRAREGRRDDDDGGTRWSGSPPLRDGVAPHSLYFTLNSRVSTEPDVLGRPIYRGAQPRRLARTATMRGRGVEREGKRGAREETGPRRETYERCTRKCRLPLLLLALESPVHSRAQLAHRRRMKRECS